MAWESGDYHYCYLLQIIQGIKFRFTFADFYAKRTENADTLKNLLKNDVINLDTLLCAKVKNIKLYRDLPVCELHAVSCPKRQGSRHCATMKANMFYQQLMNKSPFGKINFFSSSSEFVSKFDSLQLQNG